MRSIGGSKPKLGGDLAGRDPGVEPLLVKRGGGEEGSGGCFRHRRKPPPWYHGTLGMRFG